MMDLETINKLCENTLIAHLGIEFTAVTTTSLSARMEVCHKTIQPMGYLHGGASLALAETVGSAGSLLLIDPADFNVFGMQVSANHISSLREGWVYATATIIHEGRSSHVWNVDIKDGDGNLISVARVTNAIVKK